MFKEVAQCNCKDVIAKTLLISEGTSIYYTDDVFDRAAINRLVFAIGPEANVTGDYRTNPFHFRDVELGSVKITQEGTAVGATPIDMNSSHIKAYFTTMKALGLDYGGYGIILDNVHRFCFASQPTVDLLKDDGTIRPELTGTRLGREFEFATVTVETI